MGEGPGRGVAASLSGVGVGCRRICENDDFAWEVLKKSQDGDVNLIKIGDFAWEVLPKWQDDDVKRTCR